MNNSDKNQISAERVKDFQDKFTALQAETNIRVVPLINYLQEGIFPVIGLQDTTPVEEVKAEEETIKTEAEVVEEDKAA